jgi:hypothetical protein
VVAEVASQDSLEELAVLDAVLEAALDPAVALGDLPALD